MTTFCSNSKVNPILKRVAIGLLAVTAVTLPVYSQSYYGGVRGAVFD
ncbi:exported hypothetical protein [Candidatus Sulfopaludibacter sp. SbA3]|nr:exported hypothetical protein [Candidatus Sulfopaludibacter sp. SbA3]